MKNILKLIENYKVQREAFANSMKEEFMKELKIFFESQDEIKTVFWNQYIPYFNDGEECTFNVNDVYFSNSSDIDNINSYGEFNDDPPADGFIVSYRDNNISPLVQSMCKDINDVISNRAAEDMFQDMFGDHSEVFITKDGITIKDYEHD